jgi:hypothetical protein
MHKIQFSKNDQWHVSQHFPSKLCNFALKAYLEVCEAHKYQLRCCWRTAVIEESHVNFYLPTEADCENSGFHLL